MAAQDRSIWKLLTSQAAGVEIHQFILHKANALKIKAGSNLVITQNKFVSFLSKSLLVIKKASCKFLVNNLFSIIIVIDSAIILIMYPNKPI